MRFVITFSGGMAFLSGATFVGVVATTIAAVRDPLNWAVVLGIIAGVWIVLTVAAFMER